MKKAGWPIRFRLDPMVPYPDWKRGYAEAVRRINSLSPEMVTIGALRATSYNGLRNAAKANGRDESIFDYLTEEKDPSGFKYRIPFSTQVEMFRFVMNRLKTGIIPALCKEDHALWKALGMKFDGCHCLLGRNDAIVKERNAERKHAREIIPNIGIGKSLPVLA
jgi:spore photoproduct lyase